MPACSLRRCDEKTSRRSDGVRAGPSAASPYDRLAGRACTAVTLRGTAVLEGGLGYARADGVEGHREEGNPTQDDEGAEPLAEGRRRGHIAIADRCL